ncbi:uncharacterized protein K02A2.6-like [Sycon ciliatum]|uniref:uncharacterized protein K02A2.6-like n=1 Tax=Sycon ciliatum TaxID=27933 RepID=UPI0031F6CA11
MSRCGKAGHFGRDPSCPARGKTCSKCQRRGHFASCCNSQSTSHISSEPESLFDSFSIGALTDDVSPTDKCQPKSKSHPPMMIDVCVNDVVCPMEVDTGAEVSVFPSSVWKEQFSNVCLHKSRASLHSYGGSSLSVVGECIVDVRYESHQFRDTIIVVEGSGQPLFGRNWMSHVIIDWSNFRNAQVNALSLDSLLRQFPTVFQEGLGTIKGQSAKIQLQGSPTPKSCRSRPVPYAVRTKVEAELLRLEGEGIIKPVSNTDWASPVVVVKKKNNTIRLCADFKVSINKHIEANQHPIPNPSDLLSQLSGGSVFSKLDLSQAYAQLPLDDDSRRYCVIATHKGLYEFTRLPFGVSSAPSIWQKAIEQVLQGLEGVVVYFDDILICGNTQQQHDERLRAVLRRFAETGLRLRREKCEIGKPQVSYLGFTLSKAGLQPSRDKVLSIQNAPRPHDVSTLRSFLGLVNFFGRFIPNCSSLLQPLNELLKKDVVFNWTDACQSAFAKVKEFLIADPVMAHYDVTLPLILECDASPAGIGAALLHVMPDQSVRPVVYVSRALSKAESHYSQIEREALAIVFAVRRLHQYIYGRKFILRTDHKPLIKIFGEHESLSKTSASRLQRWAVILAEYDYVIEHIPGKENVLADCLSRLPLPLSAAEMSAIVSAVSSHAFDPCELMPLQSSDVAKASKYDSDISLVMSYTLHGWPATVPDRLVPYSRIRNDLSIEHGCLLWGSRVIIPVQFRRHLLEELHSSHAGVSRMKSVARSIFWWPGLDADIERLAADCSLCQESSNLPRKDSVHHWAYPNAAFERVHLDFAEFESQQFLVIVDAFSKWIDVYELGSSATTTKTVNCLLRFISTFGIPRVLVSDNGPQFASGEFAAFCAQNGIKHHRTPPYHPASNGQCERMVQELKKALRARPHHVSVCVQVSRFLFDYRNTPHSATKQSPASILLKKAPTTRLALLQPSFATAMQQAHELDSTASREFTVNAPVWVYNARPGSKPKWLEGLICKRLSTMTYSVMVGGVVRKVHIDHLKSRTAESAGLSAESDAIPTVSTPSVTPTVATATPTPELPASPPAQSSPVIDTAATTMPSTPTTATSSTPTTATPSMSTTAATPVSMPDTVQVATPVSMPDVSVPVSSTPVSPRYPSRMRRAPDRLNL